MQEQCTVNRYTKGLRELSLMKTTKMNGFTVCQYGKIGFPLMLLSSCTLKFNTTNYSNDPTFSDIQVWANSADPDQTAPRGAV